MKASNWLLISTIAAAVAWTFPASNSKAEDIPAKPEPTGFICKTIKVMKSTNNIIFSCSKIDEVKSNGN